MVLDLYNKRDLYPCSLDVENASPALVSVAAYIRYLKICIRSKSLYNAFITRITALLLTVLLRSATLQIVIKFSTTGTAYSTDNRIDINNSFAVFILLNKESVITGTYNIPLLSECILYAPSGLQITCAFSGPKATGTCIDYKDQLHSYVFNTALNFVPGYNCLPIYTTDLVILAAGTGLGKGNIKLLTVVSALGSEYAGGIIKQVKGIRAINGLTRAVNILTQGDIGLRPNLSGNTLTLTFYSLQDLEDE